MATLLEPLKALAPTRLHCVRCHETFDATRNDARACRIDHPEDGYPEEYSYRSKPIVGYEMLCCGLQWEAEDDDEDIVPPKPYCIVAKHTTDTRLVEKFWRTERFEGDGLHSDEEYEKKSERRDPTVKTCAQAGCKV